MDQHSSQARRPSTLPLDGSDTPFKSTSPSPASELDNVRFVEDLDKFNEVTEFMKEIDEILDFMKPFPRIQKENRGDETEAGSISLASSSKQMPIKKIDHLENLIRLVEQLKDLKEQNYEARERAKQFLCSKTKRHKFQFLDVADLPSPPPPPPSDSKHRPSLSFRRSSRTKAHETFTAEARKKSLSQGKSKISKWTKVKEAFRWEKASQLDTKYRLPKLDKKNIIPEAEEIVCFVPSETPLSTLLKVPDRPSGSPSPADSVLSGHISMCSSLEAPSSSCLLTTSGYSGEPSSATHSHSSVCLGDWAHYPLNAGPSEHFTQSLQEISSSSSGDEKTEDQIQKEHSKVRAIDEIDTRRSKSLDGDAILGPSMHLFHEFHEDSKSGKHKTPWEKVINIIHTRKDSLKKKPKKRDEVENFTGSADFPPCGDELSSPEEPTKECMSPKIEVTAESDALQPTSHLALRRLRNSPIRPLTPVLTLTTPSTEDIQNIVDKAANAISTDVHEHTKNHDLPSPEDKAMTSTAPCHDSTLPPSPTSILIPSRSRWGRVKKAFLTSANSEGTHYGSSSAPSSPLHLGAFFSEHDSGDEMSSGDWTETRADTVLMTASDCVFHDEFQDVAKSKEPLHVTAMVLPEPCKPHELAKRPRESLSIPLPTVNDLSPEFKKKLDEWKKIKKLPTAPLSNKDDGQGHFISRIGEWQRWRPGGGSKSDAQHHQQKHHDHHIQDEFYKKLEEWQMLKSSKRSRSQSDKGKDERDFQTPSPGISRKNSKRKKIASGKSSGTESQGGSLKEKEGRAGRKTQKEKDLLWLEKELQKIEREKLRLEREREKYMEREARLEQMKRTMGTTTPTQEVLIQTATGFFRFEGISHKFTQKLYEWEKARGIAPEASTFALLEKASVPYRVREDRLGLQRSKSVGSVIDSSSAAALSAAHHPSSLSLNDVDDLEAMEQANILADAVRMSREYCAKDDDEPEALIVDVEDIIVESAAILVDEPRVQEQVPVYSYAPAEVTHLIDSSGSDGERELYLGRATNKSQVSLIEENITLLDKIEKNETICRKIENSLVDESSEADNDQFQDEGGNLQLSFMKHSGQQEEMIHDLVDNMRMLHDANVNATSDHSGDVSHVIEMSSQLLALAQKLETTLNERHASSKQNAGHLSLKRAKGRINRLGSEKIWYSIEEGNLSTSVDSTSVPSRNEDVTVSDLSALITKKVVDLKAGLSKLRQASVDKNNTAENSENQSSDEKPHETDCTTFTFRLGKSAQKAKMDHSRESVSPEKFLIIKSEKGLEKSKAQIVCSDSAAEVYEKNLKVIGQSDGKKSPEILKKRIKDKILEMQRLASETSSRRRGKAELELPETPDEVENKEIVVEKDGSSDLIKPYLKARRVTDTAIAYEPQEAAQENQGLQDLVELTGTTPNCVFVPTSRKIISPIETDSSSSVLSYVIDDIESPTECERTIVSGRSTLTAGSAAPSSDIGTPPIPNSPSSLRKLDLKETSQSIKMMVAKYNKRASENQEKSGKPPSSWRSPVLDRKIKEQMAKFEDDGSSILKHGGKFGRGDILKSASAGLLKDTSVIETPEISANYKSYVNTSKGILKSSSTGTVKSSSWPSATPDVPPEVTPLPFTSTPVQTSQESPVYPLALRALRIRQAKAEFLAKGPGGQSLCSDVSQSQTPTSICSGFSWRAPNDKKDSASLEMKARNRLSHTSAGSEASFDGEDFPVLVKSASAGMINLARGSVNSTIAQEIQKTVSSSAVSPNTGAKSKKFNIFNIKSKFRKVKLRRTKEKDKESAVQTLVRQSLVLDVSQGGVPSQAGCSCSRSCPASPVPERSRPSQDGRKWALTRPKLFQSKERTRLVTDPTSGSIT